MFRYHLDKVHQFIEYYNINLLQCIFICFLLTMVVFGSLMHAVEAYLPVCVRQSLRYGKHAHKEPKDPFVNRLEVPKSWFAHFYVFAFSWSILALFLVLKSVITHREAPEYVLSFLDIIAGGRANRKVSVDSTDALVGAVLMSLQCGRRFYETNFVQIFSKDSKINLSHYIVGYLHYFGVILAILANTEGFVRGTIPTSFAFSKISLFQYLCVFMFHFSWIQQYRTNMILVNLRKDEKTGKVVTDKHLLPTGGFFSLVSSPHMLFEINMYAALASFFLYSFTWYLILSWVVANQIFNAILTQKWYKENFKNYPKNRYAILPFIL